MNTRCFRVIFSQARSMLVVVADILPAGRGRRSCRRSVTRPRELFAPALSTLGFALLLATGAIMPASAGVVADGSAPGGQRPTVINSANGTPQVNIQSPSAAGVSRNQYSQFDVDQKGVILNNSRTAAQTALGGRVAGNPWLAQGEARVILNEVNSRDPSRLNGYIEVAGQRAQVVIASPAGISCNGCGFINASRATLTTGQARLSNGQIAGYDVSQGTITVHGKGMDSSQQDSTDLIARAVHINAGIQARELKVTTGRNHIDAAHQTVSAMAGEGEAKPQFALDVAQMGGMYAGKIRLIGTEGGVGVRNAGHIGTSAGSVAITADGHIANSGSISSANRLDVATQGDLTNSGTLYARESSAISVAGRLTHSGTIASGQQTRVQAATIEASRKSVFAAGVDDRGQPKPGGSLTLSSSGALRAQGQLLATEQLSVQGASVDLSDSQTAGRDIAVTASSGDISTARAVISATQTLSLNTRGQLNNDGGSLAADRLSLTALQLSNQQGKLQQLGQADLTLAHQAGINNAGGSIASNGANLTLSTASLINSQGQITHAGEGQLRVSAAALAGRQGSLLTNGALLLEGGTLTLDQATTQARHISVNAGSLSGRGGEVIQTGSGEMTFNLNGTLDNSGGLIHSGGSLMVDTHGGLLLNRDSGAQGGILSAGALSLRSGAGDNRSGLILSGGDARLETGHWDNRSGTIQSGSYLHWHTSGQALINRAGVISAHTGLTLQSGDINNQQGTLAAGSELTLSSHALDNSQQGQIISKGSLRLTTVGLTNQQGRIQSLGDMVLSAKDAVINNTRGLIHSAQTLLLSAAQVVNQDTRRSDRTLGLQAARLRVTAEQLDNHQGEVLADEDLTLTLTDRLNNSSGLISSVKKASLSAATLTNRAGDIEAGQGLSLRSDWLGGEGRLLSLGNMSLSLSRDFINSGSLEAAGALSLTTAGQLANHGLVQAGGTLALRAASLLNSATGEIAAGLLQAEIAATLTNYGLLNGIYTRLNAQILNNVATGRIYGDWLAIKAGTLNNLAASGHAATLAARQRLDLGVGTLNNREHALIYSGGSLALGGTLSDDYRAVGQGGTLNNHSATLESAGDMTLNIASINNHNDHFRTENVLVSQEQVSEYQVDRLNNGVRYNVNDYDISMYKDETWVICIVGVICHNTDGDKFTHYDYTRTITEDRIAQSDPGKIIAGGSMTVGAERLLNDKSQIIAGGTLAITAGQIDNIEPVAARQIKEEGVTRRYTRKQHHGGGDSPRVVTEAWKPAVVIQDIALRPGNISGNTTGEGSGLTPDNQPESHLSGNPSGTGGVSIAPIAGSDDLSFGKILEVSREGVDSVVRTTDPDTCLPDSSLFHMRPESDSAWLIETDPRFIGEKAWLSSDWMLQAFKTDPANVHKRLGDGWYEQRLIREQIIALTGQRYLVGQQNDEDQYKALMNNGIDFGRKHNLTPGIALTAKQMSELTSDIVWMVARPIQLPDGTMQQVLVPQVYSLVRPGDIDGGGALLAGKNVQLALSGDLTNRGTVSAQQSMQMLADNINNLGGTLSGQDVWLQARTDITNTGGHVQGGDRLTAIAGRDINITTTTRSNDSFNGDSARTAINQTGSFTVTNNAGLLDIQAGRDVNLKAAIVAASGDNSRATVTAGNNLSLTTVETASRDNLSWGSDDTLRQAQSREVGTLIQGGGEVTLLAGNDLSMTAARVSANQALTAQAGNDLSIHSGTATESFDQYTKSTSSGFLSGKTTVDHNSFSDRTAVASQLDGHSVTMLAGHDLQVQGSSVVGTQDVMLHAGNNLSLTSVDEQHEVRQIHEEKKTGFSGTGGIGVSYGKQSVKTTDTLSSRTSAAATAGSVDGNLSLTAGNVLLIGGSDLLAGQDLRLSAKEVNIEAAENQRSQKQTTEQKSSGLTLALSGTAGSALNTAVTTAKQASESSGRLAALQGVQAGLNGVSAGQALQMDAAKGSDPANGNTVGANLSWGSQSSTSESRLEQTTQRGSSLTAGHNLSITASGSGVSGADGDIRVQGSQLQAGHDLLLSANRDVNLLSAAEQESTRSKNSSKGGSVGVGFGVGTGGSGFSVSGSVNSAKGHENADALSHAESQINAGNQVTLISGRDTTLTGAQVAGETVTLEVGRNLTLTSEQDKNHYDAKQQSASASGSAGAGGGSASVNVSQESMNSRWESVTDQTGIFAGSGGFDITVGEHTQLNGAVIGSTAASERNKLDTGTLGFSDIENRADYSVEHQSTGVSTGGSVDGQFAGNMANTLLTGVNGSDSASSTTHAAVSEGTIIIRDQAKQQQDVSELSRDVENANPGLAEIFDKEKEQNRLREAQLIGEIGSQVGDIARTQGDINGLNAAKEKYGPLKENATEKERAAYLDMLRNSDEYKAEMQKFGTGSALQQGIQAATAAVQGLAGGDLAKALAGGSAPYIAGVIGSSGLDDTGKVLAHAAVNAALAAAQGNSALVGAAGAATAEMVGMIALNAYGKPVSELSESEKQTVSALATLAAGLAGGLAGNGTANVVAAAQAGQTTVTNNLLGATSSDKLDKVVEKIKQGDRSLAAANELIQLENADKRSDALVSKFTSNPSQMNSSEQAELAAYLRVYASEMERTYGTAVAQELVKGLLSGQDYIKRNPDSEAMSQAQTIMNTWGYHKSNASIGDSALIFGSSVLGTTIKEGMALNAAIGVGVNTGVQLSGNDPFSYVDAIMAGVTSAATTGKGLIPSAGINMGGAAIGSGIKGEDPTNSVAGAGAGTVAGGIGGTIIKGVTSKVAEEAVSDLTGAIGGSYISEETGSFVKVHLDEKGKNENEK